jgi:protein-S-isoprenylcysteine O-methyltransferase Ste14
VTLLVAAAMWGAAFLSLPSTPNGALRYGLAVLFFLLAALFGAPAVRAFVKARTTIDPVNIDRASTIVTTGVYRFTRNPMYVAMTWLLLSWAIYLAAPLSFAGPLLFVLYITRLQIIPEERAMAAKFGADYLDYKSRVRRWL